MKPLTERIKDLIKEWDVHPILINRGLCCDFAHALWEQDKTLRIVNDEDLGAAEYSHTFIEHDGKYYDAEHPWGVRDWRQLEIYNRQKAELHELEILKTDKEFYLECMNGKTLQQRETPQEIRDGMILYHQVYCFVRKGA